jgi:hypothetical protein
MDFDKTFNIMKAFIIGVFLLIIGTWIYRIAHVANSGKEMYNITIPSMSGTAPTEYFATDYVESNGCITFKDEFGFEHKHCGAYTVTRW